MMREKGGQSQEYRACDPGAMGSSEDSSSIVSRVKAEHTGRDAGRLQDLALGGCGRSQEAFGK